MSEVVSYIVEGEFVNQFPLALCGTGLERPEPVMNPFLGQSIAALRRKDVGSISITTRLEILIERLASVIHQIDFAPLAALVADMQPADFRTNMRMGHLQPGDIADPASRPVTEREDGSTAPIPLLLNQRAQNITLIL